MRAYIYSIVCMAALGGVVLLVAPDGVRSGIKKHIRLICSLCMLCVMISPIIKIVDVINGMDDVIMESNKEDGLYGVYESMYENSSEKGFSERIDDAVREELKKNLSIPNRECRALIEFSDADEDGFREPIKITVILSGSSIFKDPKQIESIISEKFGCDCVCAIE